MVIHIVPAITDVLLIPELMPHTGVVLQSDDPAVQWQLNLYKDVVVKSEEPANPEHTVDRVQSISAALFHLDLVKAQSIYTCIPRICHRMSINKYMY